MQPPSILQLPDCFPLFPIDTLEVGCTNWVANPIATIMSRSDESPWHRNAVMRDQVRDASLILTVEKLTATVMRSKYFREECFWTVAGVSRLLGMWEQRWMID